MKWCSSFVLIVFLLSLLRKDFLLNVRYVFAIHHDLLIHLTSR